MAARRPANESPNTPVIPSSVSGTTTTTAVRTRRNTHPFITWRAAFVMAPPARVYGRSRTNTAWTLAGHQGEATSEGRGVVEAPDHELGHIAGGHASPGPRARRLGSPHSSGGRAIHQHRRSRDGPVEVAVGQHGVRQPVVGECRCQLARGHQRPERPPGTRGGGPHSLRRQFDEPTHTMAGHGGDELPRRPAVQIGGADHLGEGRSAAPRPLGPRRRRAGGRSPPATIGCRAASRRGPRAERGGLWAGESGRP